MTHLNSPLTDLGDREDVSSSCLSATSVGPEAFNLNTASNDSLSGVCSWSDSSAVSVQQEEECHEIRMNHYTFEAQKVNTGTVIISFRTDDMGG